ncbi:S-ADENOSYL-L-METHIONINE-DEPENDENT METHYLTRANSFERASE SUPERFAMILY PROTEIN [Salix purpurea]|uniref:S-ADENOSYL-L-METHIONINE-DEPENDENT METHYLTRANSFERASE SUPERFAMILY PROTEIN n=1 Tax=Salix purpurea TaxID=77065 RepID=A0A9Q0TGI8_SALPP|nr:S-ADENOSYL-L-METHIONINE-DEPENDENT METHYLTRANSFERASE SUPERFAMILY PROTEIN [Salix purpurea]
MVSGVEDYPKKHVQQQQLHTRYKLKMLVLLILTNLLTVYIFTSPYFNLRPSPMGSKNHISLPLGDPTTLLDELSSTKEQLSISHSLIAEMHKKLNSTSSLVEALLTELSSRHGGLTEKEKGSDPVKSLNAATSDEVMLVTGPHKLPLGYSPRMGSDEVYPPVGVGHA